MPDDLGPVLRNFDWIPIDLLASILMEVAELRKEGLILNGESSPPAEVKRGARVFHPYSPRLTTRAAVQACTIDELARVHPDKLIRTISLHSWIVKVKKDAESIMGNSRMIQDKLKRHFEVNPMMKCLGFYASLLLSAKEGEEANSVEEKETVKCSRKLRSLANIKDSWIQK